jgi:hypothetical protein
VTVVVERAVVVVVKLQAPSLQEAEQAFADLRTRVDFTVPKLRLGPATFTERHVTLRSVSVRGAIGARPK